MLCGSQPAPGLHFRGVSHLGGQVLGCGCAAELSAQHTRARLSPKALSAPGAWAVPGQNQRQQLAGAEATLRELENSTQHLPHLPAWASPY